MKYILSTLLIGIFSIFVTSFVYAQSTNPACSREKFEAMYRGVATNFVGDVHTMTFNDVSKLFTAAAGTDAYKCTFTQPQLKFIVDAYAFTRTGNYTSVTLPPYDINGEFLDDKTQVEFNDTQSGNVTAPTPVPCVEDNTTPKTVYDNTFIGGSFQDDGKGNLIKDKDGNPIPNTLDGNPLKEDYSNAPQCNDSQLTTINPCTLINQKTKDTFKVNILWGTIDVGEFMSNIAGGLDLYGGEGDAEDIGSNGKENNKDRFSRLLGSCNAGFIPQLREDPGDKTQAVCRCVPGQTDAQIKAQFCAIYLSSAKNIGREGGLEDDKDIENCTNCFTRGGYWSGLGCVKVNSIQDFIQGTLFGWGLSLAGFAALCCIAFSAVQMQLSQGNAEKIKKSQELLTSCIMGFMLIIFSIFILRVIGVDILRIPGFF